MWNNVLVKNRMSTAPEAPWQQHGTSVITWKGYTVSEFARNIVVVDLAGRAGPAGTGPLRWPHYKGGPVLMTIACAKQFHVAPNSTCGDRPLDNFVQTTIDSNVYFNVSDAGELAIRGDGFVGLSFQQWQRRGHDQHGVVADPLFVGASVGDYRLHPSSPALARGFVPLDMTDVGPDW